MADRSENSVVRLIRFLALGVPTVSRIVAVALVMVAGGIAFFNIGDYQDDNSRAEAAFLLAAAAIAAVAIGLLLPGLVRRFLPPR
ncbi:MAG: hypothetical protein GY798_10905 [Hyphomicrobiales bacterium]|nr:hypothetical protein [Hyphomicrobiales bacterium]